MLETLAEQLGQQELEQGWEPQLAQGQLVGLVVVWRWVVV